MQQLFVISISQSAWGASTGQTLAHVPQSMHSSASITYFPSFSEIQLTGHSLSQEPQAMQSSEILYAIPIHLQTLHCRKQNRHFRFTANIVAQKSKMSMFFWNKNIRWKMETGGRWFVYELRRISNTIRRKWSQYCQQYRAVVCCNWRPNHESISFAYRQKNLFIENPNVVYNKITFAEYSEMINIVLNS